MPKDEAGNEIVVDEKKDDALSILEEVKAALAKNKEENPVKTDPQPPVNNDRRKAFMEQNKLNEDQVRLIEAGQVTDQKLALMEVRQNNKDYELLEKDFWKRSKNTMATSALWIQPTPTISLWPSKEEQSHRVVISRLPRSRIVNKNHRIRVSWKAGSPEAGLPLAPGGNPRKKKSPRAAPIH